ncbi:MAG: efflux RND transporter periplasmic adaptor subunit [Geminicoccaceae bacterium]
MKSSYLIAAVIALAVTGWLLSGQPFVQERLAGLGGAQTPPAGEAEGVLPADSEAAAASEADARAPFSVRVHASQAAPIARQLPLNGVTKPNRLVQVRAEANGRIVERPVERGDSVQDGDLLAQIDQRDLQAIMEQADALVAQRQLEADAAKQLGTRGYAAETRVKEAEALLRDALAQRKRATIALENTAVRAPFDATVEQLVVEVGDYVENGDPIARLIESDPFLVLGYVAEDDIGKLHTGLTGSVRLPTGDVYQGEVTFVAREANAETRTFEIELTVPDPEGRFVANATADLLLELDEVPAHAVSPSLLVLDDAGRLGIKAVDADDTVVFHTAQIVRSTPEAVYLTGLPETLRLITVGQGFVREGDHVKPVPEEQVAQADGGDA